MMRVNNLHIIHHVKNLHNEEDDDQIDHELETSLEKPDWKVNHVIAKNHLNSKSY